jgi:hypothetical protein
MEGLKKYITESVVVGSMGLSQHLSRGTVKIP